jgi:hypothetical protein
MAESVYHRRSNIPNLGQSLSETNSLNFPLYNRDAWDGLFVNFSIDRTQGETLSPKRVQKCVSYRSGIEALAGGAQAATALHASQLQPKVCILLQYA